MSALNGSLQTMCAAATALVTFTRNATSGGRKRRCFDVHSSRDFHAPISVGLCGALNSPIAGAAGQDVSHAIKEKPESILAQISQETLAEMIGTTRLGTHSNPCDHYGCKGETTRKNGRAISRRPSSQSSLPGSITTISGKGPILSADSC